MLFPTPSLSRLAPSALDLATRYAYTDARPLDAHDLAGSGGDAARPGTGMAGRAFVFDDDSPTRTWIQGGNTLITLRSGRFRWCEVTVRKVTGTVRWMMQMEHDEAQQQRGGGGPLGDGVNNNAMVMPLPSDGLAPLSLPQHFDATALLVERFLRDADAPVVGEVAGVEAGAHSSDHTGTVPGGWVCAKVLHPGCDGG